MGVEIKHLDFVDAQWRKKNKLTFLERMFGNHVPELLHIYPTYRWHVISGKISRHDAGLIESLKKILSEMKNAEKKSIIFCPAGIGNHIDHIITRNCCLDLFDNLVLWSDFPYSEKSSLDLPRIEKYDEIAYSFDKLEKRSLIESYETQYAAMFPEGKIDIGDEKYYIKKGALLITAGYKEKIA